MAALYSRQVTTRFRECMFVLSAFLMEGSHVAAALLGLTQPNLEENDEIPGFASVIVGLGRNIKAAIDLLMTADSRVAAAVAWESALRQDHQEKSEQQGLSIIAMRRTMIGQFEGSDLDNLGLQPLDVRDSVTVARRSQLIGERFEAPNVLKLMGEPRFGDPPDLGPSLQRITDGAKELLDLNEQINEAVRDTARKRLERDERMKEYDRLFLRSARIFEDFCRVAGLDKLAERIRVTAARARQRVDGESEDSGPGDGADPGADVPEPQPPPVTPEPDGDHASG